MEIYIYIYVHIYTYIHVHIYIHIYTIHTVKESVNCILLLPRKIATVLPMAHSKALRSVPSPGRSAAVGKRRRALWQARQRCASKGSHQYLSSKWVSLSIQVYMYGYIYLYTWIWISVYICINIKACMCIYIYVCKCMMIFVEIDQS